MQKFAFLFCVAFSVAAQARTYDLYRAYDTKGDFCSVIGGACASDTALGSGFFQNPASLGATSDGFDFDGDYNPSTNLEPGGGARQSKRETSYMGALGFAASRWAFGFAFTGRHAHVETNAGVIDNAGSPQTLAATDISNIFAFHVPFSYRYSEKLTFGAAVRGLVYSEDLSLNGQIVADAHTKNSGPSFGATFGAMYIRDSRWRYGAWFRTGLNFSTTLDLSNPSLNPYHEDMILRFPWTFSTGLSFMPWEDERTLLVDLVLIGNTSGGYLLTHDSYTSTLNDEILYGKGKNLALEPRVGWRAPIGHKKWAGYLIGSYWESGRVQGSSGRIHLTAGFSYRAFRWLELLVGADFAPHFGQLLLDFR